MIRVERATDLSATAEWEKLVEVCGGNPLHLPAVHYVDHDPKNSRPLVFRRNGHIVACAAAFLLARRVAIWFRSGERTLLLPTPPATIETTTPSEVCASLIAFARDSGYHRLVMHRACGEWLDEDNFMSRYRMTSTQEFVIDLDRELREIQGDMHKTHRKNVRRAASKGLRIASDSSFQAVLRLRDMQVSSAERSMQKGGGFGVRNKAFFRKLYDHVYATGHGHMLFAWLEEECVAGLAYLVTAQRALTVRSGSSPRGYETRAMYLLYDELIRRAKEAGLREVNIGGVPVEASKSGHPQSGLYDFKRGFGGRSVVRTALDIPLRGLQA